MLGNDEIRMTNVQGTVELPRLPLTIAGTPGRELPGESRRPACSGTSAAKTGRFDPIIHLCLTTAPYPCTLPELERTLLSPAPSFGDPLPARFRASNLCRGRPQLDCASLSTG